MTDFEGYLNEHGKLIYTNVGVSMLPLLRQGKDLFILQKKKGRCNVGDVVLYRRKHQYVLHRVIEVKTNDYVILGDNCIEKEYGITDDDILAVMTNFVRNGKNYTVRNLGYRFYSFIWLRTIKPRVFMKKTLSFVKRLIKV